MDGVARMGGLRTFHGFVRLVTFRDGHNGTSGKCSITSRRLLASVPETKAALTCLC
jgi:hypothetical protein